MFCPFLSIGQLDSLEFEKYTMTDGLSDNVLSSITQDNEGYIWIGSINGLNRFDGSKFKTYYQQQNPFNLPGNYIHRIKRFKNGKLGVVTRRGFCEINTENYNSTNYLLKDTTSFSIHLNNFFDATEFSAGRYGITSGTGFYVFNSDGTLFFRSDHFTSKDVSTNRMNYAHDIFKIGDDEILIYTGNTLSYFNLKTKKIQELQRNDNKYTAFYPSETSFTIRKQLNKNEYIHLSFEKNTIQYYNRAENKKVISALNFNSIVELYWASYIFSLNDTTFAINSRLGGMYIFKLNKKTGAITFKQKKELIDFRCNWLFKDKDERLWITTDVGLLKQKTTAPLIKSWQYNNPKESEGNAYFDNLLLVKGNLYITRYSNKNSLFIVDAKTMTLKNKVTFFNKNSDWNLILSIQNYHHDTLWISTRPGILWFDTKTATYGKLSLPESLQNKALVLGPITPYGEAWFFSYLNNTAVKYDLQKRTFTIYDKNTNPPFLFTRPKHIILDSDTNLWFAGHGLTRYNRKSGSFDTLILKFIGINKFEDNILAIAPDKKNNLWFHTVDNGLIQYNVHTKTYTDFTMKDGLPSNIILAMSQIVNDHLWLGMAQKLVYFNLHDKSIKVLNAEDGLPLENFTGAEMYTHANSGKTFAAMNNHVISFNSELKSDTKNKSLFYIDELLIGNQTALNRPADTLYLRYNQNNIQLKLNIIDYDSKSGCDFFYSINGNSTALKSPESILNLHLETGFNILKINAKGKYDKPLYKQLVIFVQPPFWKTWWFISASLLFALLSIYWIIKLRLNKIRKEAALNQQLSEFELKALHAQMNPHFIFNCLNSIKSLILYNRNKEASEYLNKFSSLVRQNLDHSRKQFLTLQQNIDYIKQYVEIESLRFDDLKFELTVAAEIDTLDAKIAPMLIQPLIENAIWHGLQSRAGNKNLKINFTTNGSEIICEIEDNGVGINQTQNHRADHNSIGIENIQKRIDLLNEKYHLDYSLKIKDRSEDHEHETGTLVTLSFKYI